ncbi:MAG: hypothetical protein PVJ55_01980 [Anaerolineae bacterium]|jgi:hypothetical protein
MSVRLAQAKRAKDAHTAVLLRKRNVVGVGLGYKIRKGESTGELSVVVSVTRKQPPSALSARDLVPRTLENIKTDVVATGPLRPLPIESTDLGPRDRWRPVVPPGVSIAHYFVSAGTFGCLVTRGDELFILSNNHVLANTNVCDTWDPILQPGSADGGGPDDRIARLADYVPLVFESEPSECSIADWTAKLLSRLAGALGSSHRLEAVKKSGGPNRVDAALARPLTPNHVTNEILGIGEPTGIAAASLGTSLQKAGRTTGRTEGVVTQIEATLLIDYYGPKALFTDQLVASPMSEGGDSGSAMLDSRRRVVGLLFAGSKAATCFNPIHAVLSGLDVGIV